MTHTPGPWYVVFLDRNKPKITHDKLEGASSVEELIANYYMMAAAPEMYDTLKSMLSYPLPDSMTKAIMKAINKAKPSRKQIEDDRNKDFIESQDV